MKRAWLERRGISYRIQQGTLIIDLKKLHRIISSAPRGGGLLRARSILNHQVPANPLTGKRPITKQWCEPARYLGRLAARLKAKLPVVGLMTAVPMKQLVVDREEWGRVWIECFCTVGVTNAVRAGEYPRVNHEDYDAPGTINIILVTNATLSRMALVGAVQVVTESKTGTLIQYRVRSAARASLLATGTGTDAVVIASSPEGVYRVPYSGTHTKVGMMIGRLVTRCVQEGLRRSGRWSQSRPRRGPRSRTPSH